MNDTGFIHDPAVYINLLQDNLRNRYKDPYDIPKELIQNADDAQAKVLHFGWTRGLDKANHELLKGPAIFVVNDGPFQRKDARAIRSLGINSKASDRSSIGKFGLGLKSVFRVCEAFFYLASHIKDLDSENSSCRKILNPWTDTGFHEEWNRFEDADQELLMEHLRPLLPADTWFCLWFPLRQPKHCEGCDPIIQQTFDVSCDRVIAELFPADLAQQIGSFLPVMPTLEKVTLWLPWSVSKETSIRVSVAEKADRCRFPRRLDSELGRIDGQVEVRNGSKLTQNIHFSGYESWVPSLDEMRDHGDWPKVFSLRDGRSVRDREKAEPHCAACFCVTDSEEATLSIRRAVFLPLSNQYTKYETSRWTRLSSCK